jgi:hypothetical protein
MKRGGWIQITMFKDDSGVVTCHVQGGGNPMCESRAVGFTARNERVAVREAERLLLTFGGRVRKRKPRK